MRKVNTASTNIEKDNLIKLRRVFPQFIKDNQIDFDALKTFFEKEGILTGEEKYGLNWAGKSNAFKLIRRPSVGTLTPDEKESVDWDKTQNLFIEGDNLEVLKLLQKNYREKIKMIYIDPPYNTGKDRVYKDDYKEDISEYYERTGQSKNGIKLISNPESSGRYHSDWLTMMYPRLFLARNLLKEDGVIFVSIDDNEAANLKLIVNEIFGEENFAAQIPWRKRTAKSDVPYGISQDFEWLLVYAKSDSFSAKVIGKSRKYYETSDLPGRRWRIHGMTTQRTASERPNSNFTIVDPKNKKEYPVNPNAVWRITKNSFKKFLSEYKIVFPGDYKFLNISQPVLRYFEDEDRKRLGASFGYAPMSTLLPKQVGMTLDGTKEIIGLFGSKIYSFPKPIGLIKHIVNSGTDKDDMILDFFAGSGTTAHAVMDFNAKDNGNRKWICVQLPEETEEKSEARKAGFNTISEIARERIRRAAKKIAGENKGKKLDLGFKAYVLQKSNYRQWNVLTDKDDEKKLKQQMKLIMDKPLIDGYNEQSVVYEILLKEGFDLNAQVKKEEVDGLAIWKITSENKRMIVCFAKELTKDQIEKLDLGENDTFVCFDSALDDTTKVNVCRNLSVKVV